MKKEKIQKIKKYGLPIITALALLGCLYFYYQLRVSSNNPEIILKNESIEIVRKISKIMILPENETPTIATVSDPLALKNQVFFVNSQKGDKVLIYTQARKAILYRPTQDKIVEVTSLSIEEKNAPILNTAEGADPVNTNIVPVKNTLKKK